MKLQAAKIGEAKSTEKLIHFFRLNSAEEQSDQNPYDVRNSLASSPSRHMFGRVNKALSDSNR